jgi:hypothetical protein
MFAVAVAGVGRVKAYTETTQKFSLSKGTPATATPFRYSIPIAQSKVVLSGKIKCNLVRLQ